MTPKTVAKKNDIQKLQRAIVDGLEGVKAQDIVVFDTEHLSALFERVIVASGTSNRQTKALAASVVDAVRDAGFNKPRVEGEGNGEWIIIDCGQAVVHVMQPNIRLYYHLEELWGEKPVRLKLGAAKPAVPTAAKAKEPKPATKAALPSLKRTSAAKKGVEEAFPSKAQVKKKADLAAAAAKKAAPRAAVSAAVKTPAKAATKQAVKVVGKPATKPPVKRAAPAGVKSKPAAKKVASRKA